MATKQFNSRIQWKKDTASNWTSNNPVLLNGEIAIVVTNSGETRFKVGDGTSSFTQLPFQDEAVRALITAVEEEVETKITAPEGGTEGQVLTKTADGVAWDDAPTPSASPFNSTYEGTLATTNWVGSSGQYYYQINLDDVTSQTIPLVFPQWTSNRTNEEAAWNTLDSAVETFDGYVRFYAPAPITTAVPFVMYYTNYDSSVVTLVNNLGGAFSRVNGTFTPL